MRDYIDRNWNGERNGISPRRFFGVDFSGELDDSGFAVYSLTREAKEIYSEARRMDGKILETQSPTAGVTRSTSGSVGQCPP
jgi:hypothetical protein